MQKNAPIFSGRCSRRPGRERCQKNKAELGLNVIRTFADPRRQIEQGVAQDFFLRIIEVIRFAVVHAVQFVVEP